MAERQWAKQFYKDFDRGNHGVCSICSLLYVKEYPEDRKYHRTFHKQVVEVFNPRPLASIAKLHLRYGTFIPVRASSPEFLRRKLNRTSRVFKREFGCDFTLYDQSHDDGHGFIISDSEGRSIGGTTIRWIEYQNAPASWIFCWIWIAPNFRRRGLFRQTWSMVKGAYPGVDPDPPFSKSAALFFANRDDVSERIRKYAQGQLKADRF